MRTKGRRTPLLLGLLLLLVVVLVGGYFLLTSGALEPTQGQLPAATPPPTAVPKVRVVVASQPVNANVVLTQELVGRYFETRDVERSEVPEFAITSLGDLVNKVTVVALETGQMALETQFIPASLSYYIPEGKRAMPLLVDAFSGVVGKVRAQDYVDVIFSGYLELHYPRQFPPPTETTETLMAPASLLSVKTVLQDVLVLDIISATVSAQGTGGTQPAPTPATVQQAPITSAQWIVILAVDDQQAEVLQYAAQQGMQVQLLLRPRGDHTLTTTTGITIYILVDQYGIPIPRYLTYPIQPGELPSGIIP